MSIDLQEANCPSTLCICDQCMLPESRRALIRESIDALEYTIVRSDRDGVNLLYTVGLTENFNLPEVLVTADACEVQLANLINRVVKHLRCVRVALKKHSFKTIPIGNIVIGFRTVDAEEKLKNCEYISEFYQEPSEVKQLVIPDEEGRLPWNDAFDEEFGKGLRQALLFQN